ncbi:MAG TPA: hypothetical protein VMT22_01045 [Terriglobales bacterium]|nr:hypothetical protein [Terriglobales bacterium]
MKTEPVHDAIFQALVDIRKNLDEKVNLLDEQIRNAQLQCLADTFQQQKEALADCVDGIDQELVKLSVYLEEYWHLHASFNDLNTKISGLGGMPLTVPEPLTGGSPATVLAGRFDFLKSHGRI